jgi:hypothetical protein
MDTTYRTQASRRFFVSARRMKAGLLGRIALVWMLSLPACAVAEVFVSMTLVLTVVGVSLAGILALTAYGLSSRQVALDAGPHGITIDDGRGGTFPTSNARLGRWNLEVYGVAAGTAVHFQNGERRYCLGGRDHRAPTTAILDAPPVADVDGWLPIDAFDALLTAMNSPWAPGLASLSPGAVRCELAPNRANGVFAGRGIAPLVLELDAHDLRIFDPATRRLLAAAPVASVRFERAQHHYSGGRSSFTMPAFVLRVPGFPPICAGVPDFRFSGLGPVAKPGPPPYAVGAPDWLTLVDRFQARGLLEIGKGQS